MEITVKPGTINFIIVRTSFTPEADSEMEETDFVLS